LTLEPDAAFSARLLPEETIPGFPGGKTLNVAYAPG
jgi:hypothetical protein